VSEQRRPRILVVDDDPGLQHAVKRLLSGDYDLACCSSPQDAIGEAATFRPDLAILDIYMPEMNGFELMRELRSVARDLDVIIMTGDTTEPDANLVRAIDEGAFYFLQKPFDRHVLLTLVSRCLELRRLRHEKQQYLNHMQRELADARKFQLSFLPPASSRLGNLQIAARYVPCTELAGDFYDYAPSQTGQVALLVADVVGHGASAAMMTGVVKSAFRSANNCDYHPEAVIEQLERSLRPFEDCRFVTVFTCRIDTRENQLHYANAGHPPAILRRVNGSIELLEATGTVVGGGFSDVPCETGSVPFRVGDSLFVYTDGLAEADGGQGMFGHGRIRSLIGECRLQNSELLDHMLAQLESFTGSDSYDDDVTLLTVGSASAPSP